MHDNTNRFVLELLIDTRRQPDGSIRVRTESTSREANAKLMSSERRKDSTQVCALHTGIWNLSRKHPGFSSVGRRSARSLFPSLSFCHPPIPPLHRPHRLFHQSWQCERTLHSALINILQKKTTKLENWHTLGARHVFFSVPHTHTPCQCVMVLEPRKRPL